MRSHAMNSLTDVVVTSPVPMAIPGANCLTIPKCLAWQESNSSGHDSAIAAQRLQTRIA